MQVPAAYRFPNLRDYKSNKPAATNRDETFEPGSGATTPSKRFKTPNSVAPERTLEAPTDTTKHRTFSRHATKSSNINADSIFEYITALEAKIEKLEKEVVDVKTRAGAAEKKLTALKNIVGSEDGC